MSEETAPPDGLRADLTAAREAGYLLEIDETVDPNLEMARIILEHDGRPILFRHVRGFPGWQTAAGLASDRRYFAQALGLSLAEVLPRLALAMEQPQKPPLVDRAPCQAVVEEPVDLNRLPILRHFSFDGGPYITAAILIYHDPEFGPNVSFHRLLRLDERRFAARVVEGRGLDQAWRKSDSDLPVAVCIGNNLTTLLAASMSPATGVDELGIAHALRPTPLARCKSIPLLVPAESEIVLEGRLTHSLVDEGPFVDLTETMDFVRRGPIIEIDCFTHRREPVFQALLPGKLEHKLLMGMPKEPGIYTAVNKVCRCVNAAVTPGGTSWLHAVIQIDKQAEGDGPAAIEAAFRAHPSLKHAVVVDADIDPYNPAEVEWAIATRFQADRDLILLRDQPGSSLDPSGRQEPGKKARTAKMGLDATIPWGARRDKFEKVRFA